MQINLSKIILYLGLTLSAIYCGQQFVSRYSLLMSTEVDSDPYAYAAVPGTEAGPSNPATTNDVEAAVEPATGTDPAPADPEEPEDPIEVTTTNAAAATAPVEPDRPDQEVLTKGGLERGSSPDVSGIGLYAGVLFGILIVLGIMSAHDVSTFMAQRAHKLLHNEDGEGIHDVNYDQAEKVWADGDFLEAVRLMREYVQKNPREVHAMIRIAEIYEKDLGNYLAAALEYEEILKQKLPAERWGWAAIHLVNLYYGKLDRPKDGLALLWRIHREFGHTQAAGKARKRLAQIDPDFAIEEARLEREAAEREALEQAGEEEEPDELSAAPAWVPPDDDPGSNLPKGFRPKK